MAKWTTQSSEQHKPVDIESKFKGTLVKRAKKRSGAQIGDRSWVVDGDPKLGDSYDEYFVSLPEGGYKYSCSCQGHQGGEFRKVCSHALYVMLARRGKVPIDVDIHKPPEIAGALDIPLSPNPKEHGHYPFHVYVEGSGASPEEIREALDAEFCTSMEYRPLPEWVGSIRPSQQAALEQIQQLYDEGKKVVFLDAPTGVGKTLIGEMVRRKVAPGGRAVYTCSTLTLQDQFLEDFPYADVIKGRSNYPTQNNPRGWPLVNASLCTSAQSNACDLCENPKSCPYVMAREVALRSRLAVANIAYLLTMANYQRRFTNEGFIIIDEADVLEQQLLSFITLSLSKGRMKQYGITPPAKKTVMDSWVEWVRKEAYPKILHRTHMIDSIHNWRKNPKLNKEMMGLNTMLYRLKDLGGWDSATSDWLEDEHGMEGWVYMDYEKGDVTFKPIKVGDYAQELLWKHAKQWLLMSATIISAGQMAEDLGLEDDEWGVVTIGSDFPVEARPIYVQPVANMTWKEKEDEWPKMAEVVDSIADFHHDERILVHTVSYKLTEFIKGALGENRSRVFTYANSKTREKALEDWLNSDNGIMLAPSFERGVDLKYDRCRVIVVAKVPFPSLGDKQVNGRLYSRGGQGWYSMLTVRSIVQMTGRGMRSKDDRCETYILDQQFVKNVMNKNRRLLPGWWSEALVKSGIPKDRGIL